MHACTHARMHVHPHAQPSWWGTKLGLWCPPQMALAGSRPWRRHTRRAWRAGTAQGASAWRAVNAAGCTPAFPGCNRRRHRPPGRTAARWRSWSPATPAPCQTVPSGPGCGPGAARTAPPVRPGPRQSPGMVAARRCSPWLPTAASSEGRGWGQDEEAATYRSNTGARVWTGWHASHPARPAQDHTATQTHTLASTLQCMSGQTAAHAT
jgi:hypothetical protein